MKKVPLSKSMPIYIMSVIILFDIAIVIKDLLNKNAATAIILLVLGVFLGYRCVTSFIEIRKEYK